MFCTNGDAIFQPKQHTFHLKTSPTSLENDTSLND